MTKGGSFSEPSQSEQIKTVNNSLLFLPDLNFLNLIT